MLIIIIIIQHIFKLKAIREESYFFFNFIIIVQLKIRNRRGLKKKLNDINGNYITVIKLKLGKKKCFYLIEKKINK